MKALKYTLFLSITMMLACTKPPDYSDTPEIAFVSLSKNTMVADAGFLDNLTLTISFTDGDGDIDCDDDDCGQPSITSVTANDPNNCQDLNNGSISISASGSNLAYSIDGGLGKNPLQGAQIHYVLNKQVSEDVPMSIEIMNSSGEVIHSEFTDTPRIACDTLIKRQLKRTKGAHRYRWNMKVGRFDCLKELYTTNRDLTAYNAPPGKYTVRLKVGSFNQTQDFEIKIDPRIESTVEDLQAQFDYLISIRDKLSDAKV